MAKRRSYEDDDYGYDGWYTPSRPIAADGIKAKSRSGAFGSSWWAKRWIGVLESFGWGNRLQRGRSYARSGQVLSIDLQPGQVVAKVQGSRPTPYKVTIGIPPLTYVQWEKAIDAMSAQAIFAAKLLAGEMPQDIEEAFKSANVPLFPQSSRDITTQCSCPDSANPCKHVAAVYYLLGERFDEDPFLLFHLRGRTREQIIDALRARRAAATAKAEAQLVVPPEPVPALADSLATFFQAGPDLATIPIQIAAPQVEAAVVRRLGTAPMDTDADLRAVYRAMTDRALERVFGQEGLTAS